MTEASEGTTLLDLLLIQDLGNEIYQRLRGDTNISGRRALRLACKGLRDFVGQHVQLLSLDLPSRVEVAQLDACRLGKSGLRPKHLALCTIGKNVEDVLATQEIAPALKLVSKLDMRFLAFSAKLCQALSVNMRHLQSLVFTAMGNSDGWASVTSDTLPHLCDITVKPGPPTCNRLPPCFWPALSNLPALTKLHFSISISYNDLPFLSGLLNLQYLFIGALSLHDTGLEFLQKKASTMRIKLPTLRVFQVDELLAQAAAVFETPQLCLLQHTGGATKPVTFQLTSQTSADAQALRQSGGLLRCCNNLTIYSLASEGPVPRDEVESILVALGQSWHLDPSFLEPAPTTSASEISSRSAKAPSSTVQPYSWALQGSWPQGWQSSAAYSSSALSTSAACVSTVSTAASSSRNSRLGNAAAAGDGKPHSSSGTWALHLVNMRCTRVALAALPQGLTFLELRSCHLQPDAVLGIAQLHNLQSLKIDNGAWMDASALRLLLREAVQGERLHIRIVHHRDFADYSIAVTEEQAREVVQQILRMRGPQNTPHVTLHGIQLPRSVT